MTVAAAQPVVFDGAEPGLLLSRVVRGVVGGEVTGAVFALLAMWYTTSLNQRHGSVMPWPR